MQMAHSGFILMKKGSKIFFTDILLEKGGQTAILRFSTSKTLDASILETMILEVICHLKSLWHIKELVSEQGYS